MKIKILAKEYDVQLVNDKELQKVINTEEVGYAGLCLESESKIYINNTFDTQEQRLTLVHEILHAVYSQYGDDDLNNNEEHINRLSTAITQILLDNPTLTQMFLER